jgi:hypothetical protein
MDIEPPQVLSLLCQFSFPISGPVIFSADCDFWSEQKRRHQQEVTVVTFVQPLKISVNFIPPYLYYGIEVCVPFPVCDLSVAVRGSEKRIVARLLQPGESIRGISELKVWQQLLFVSWHLPFARDLRCQASIPAPVPPESDSVEVRFVGGPSFARTLVPFEVEVRIRNALPRAIEGWMRVPLNRNSIMIYGENEFFFGEVDANCEWIGRLTFVAQVEGDFAYPPCEFTIDGSECFTIQPSEGILVVGSGLAHVDPAL